MTDGASMKRAAFLSEAIRIAPEGKSLSSGWPFCPWRRPGQSPVRFWSRL